MTLLKLVYIKDYASSTDNLDLLCFSGDEGFQIANNGWLPVIGRGRAQESLTIHARGDNQDEVIAYLQSLLKTWQNYVIWSQDSSQERSVWLQVQWEDESYTRQARILSFDFQINASPFGEFWQDNNFTEATITFERLEWEQVPPLPASIVLPAGQSVLAGMVSIGSSIVTGDIGARIVNFRVNGNDYFAPNTLWFGMRRNRAGNPALFEPLWEAEDGTPGTDTTLQGNATASMGSILATSFATVATLTRRLFIKLQDITGQYNAQRGRFVVLYRAMNSDDTTVTNARLIFGSGGKYVTRPRVQITGTMNWQLFEMGVVSIPAERVPKLDASTENALFSDFFIGIESERVSGTGHLYSDCLILIPLDEGYLKVSGPTAYLSSSSHLFVFQNELGDLSGYTGTDLAVGNAIDLEANNWSIPPEITQNQVYLIFAGDATGINSYAGDIRIEYIPRWLLARGIQNG